MLYYICNHIYSGGGEGGREGKVGGSLVVGCFVPEEKCGACVCDETEDWFSVRELCRDTYGSKILLLSVARLVSRLRWLRDTAEILGFNSHTAPLLFFRYNICVELG